MVFREKISSCIQILLIVFCKVVIRSNWPFFMSQLLDALTSSKNESIVLVYAGFGQFISILLFFLLYQLFRLKVTSAKKIFFVVR